MRKRPIYLKDERVCPVPTAKVRNLRKKFAQENFAQELAPGSGAQGNARKPLLHRGLDRRRMNVAVGVADNFGAKAEGAEDDKHIFDVGHGRNSCGG
jgi:hypothetical protein